MPLLPAVCSPLAGKHSSSDQTLPWVQAKEETNVGAQVCDFQPGVTSAAFQQGACFSGKVWKHHLRGVITQCFPWANLGVNICTAASTKPVSERKKDLYHFHPSSQQYKSRIKVSSRHFSTWKHSLLCYGPALNMVSLVTPLEGLLYVDTEHSNFAKYQFAEEMFQIVMCSSRILIWGSRDSAKIPSYLASSSHFIRQLIPRVRKKLKPGWWVVPLP